MSDERTTAAAAVASGNWRKAEEMLLRWIDRYPNDLHALTNWADIQFQKGNYGLSVHIYRYLLREWLDMPGDIKPIIWANIGQALLIERYQDEAEVAFRRAMELNPEHPAIYNAIGACYINQGQPDKVIHWCGKALELDPTMPQALWNQSIGYLEKGDWGKGWPGYLHGDRITQQRSYTEGRQMRMWDGKANRVVVAWGEQGVGDEIMFSSCLPDFIKKCKTPIVDCHPRLEKTFRRSFPNVPVYGTRKSNQILWHHDHKIDSQIAMGSLPSMYRKSRSDCPGTPYLKADPDRVAYWRKRLEALGSGPYIGVAWFGGEKKTRFDYRSIPLKDWKPIFDSGCTFVSLQYNKWGHKSEAEACGLPHWDDAIGDNSTSLDEMFNLIGALDLVVSVCQTVVHMSGAIGKDCLCLTPARPAWRYGVSGDHMAWYGNTVRLIRQEEESGWGPVIQKVANELTEMRSRDGDDNRAQDIPVDGRGWVQQVEAG